MNVDSSFGIDPELVCLPRGYHHISDDSEGTQTDTQELEQAKKRIKALEDKIAGLTESNAALAADINAILTGTVSGRGMQKEEPDSAYHGDQSDEGELTGASRATDDESADHSHGENSDNPDAESPELTSSPRLTPLFIPPPQRNDLPDLPPQPWSPAPLAPGVDLDSSIETNNDYDEPVATMIGEAQRKIECLLFVEDAYPSIRTLITWSFTCWEKTCLEAGIFFALSRDMGRLVSTLRFAKTIRTLTLQ